MEYLRELNLTSMILRLVLAMLAGGILGIDRERRGRPAGFRTYMLVALGASITMILSQYLDLLLSTRWAQDAAEIGIKTDLSRLGAQVINGVGFLGAGTVIITSKHEVKGLTTAAGLWACACMGIAIGAGFYECLLFGVILMWLCMKVFPYIENYVMAKSKNMMVYVEMESMNDLGVIANNIKQNDMKVYDIETFRESKIHDTQAVAVLALGLPPKISHADVLAKLSTFEGILAVEEV